VIDQAAANSAPSSRGGRNQATRRRPARDIPIATSHGKIRCRNCRGQQKYLLCRWRWFLLEGQISNKDQINVIYRHLSSSDTIVAVGTWTKKK